MMKQRLLCGLTIALLAGGGVSQEQAAGRAADDPPARWAAQERRRPRARPRRPSPCRNRRRFRPSRRSPTIRCSKGDLDTINKNSPFQPVFFPLDSVEVDQAGQQALANNATILKKYPELDHHH